MIFGSVKIDGDAVSTHRDSYLLSSLTVVSVRRPFLGPGLLFVVGFGGFGYAFADLLYPNEQAFLIGGGVLALFAGVWVGQLKLLSRDLRNSELSGAVWGSYNHLNRIRADIVSWLRQARSEQDR